MTVGIGTGSGELIHSKHVFHFHSHGNKQDASSRSDFREVISQARTKSVALWVCLWVSHSGIRSLCDF